MLQVRFRLRDHFRDAFHALADVWDSLLGRRELPRDKQIEAVGEALVVDQRIPVGFLQFLQLEDGAFHIFLEDPEVDAVRAGQIGGSFETVQFFEQRFMVCQLLCPRLGGIIGQFAIETMIAQFRRSFRMSPENILDVIAGELLEFVIRGRGVMCVEGRRD